MRGLPSSSQDGLPGRALGQLLHGAVEGGSIAGRDHFGEPLHERERARGKLLVDRAAGRRQRQKRFAQIRPVGASVEKSTLLELRYGARDLGLVHVGVGADCLPGHRAALAQGDEHAPFRYSNTITTVDARERLGH